MKIEKCQKPVCYMYDKKNYAVHIKAVEQALNYGMILKKVHRAIKFNKAWLNPYIDMNKELR